MREKNRIFSAALILIFSSVLVACGHSYRNGRGGDGTVVFYAVADMQPTKGNKTQGKIWFSESYGSVNIKADITGLDPSTKHGFHIHEFGDCTGEDANTAGGHYNPEGHDHAGPTDKIRHAGDLGNLSADDKGRAAPSFAVKGISVFGAKNPILGRSVIIHKNPDDLMSQPTGGAGARIACGVIGAAGKVP